MPTGAMAMTAAVQLRLQGGMDHLRIAWQTGETLLESVPFVEDPEGTRYNVLLAIQEMVTNVLRHAYAGDESLPVELHFTASEDGIEVLLRDQGQAFDPTVNQPEVASGEEFPKQEGGYGILITQMVMDEVEYRRDGQWNELRLHKTARARVTQS